MRTTREVLTDWRMVLSLAVLLAVAWLVYVGTLGAQEAAAKNRRVDNLVERQAILVRVVERQQATIDRLVQRVRVLRDQLQEEIQK